MAKPAIQTRRSQQIGRTYATALCASLPLALLDGGLAALVGDLQVRQPLDLVRFGCFVAGSYALLALALATLEIPFVMLLRTQEEPPTRGQRAARGHAAAIAILVALAPLDPLAGLLRQSLTRTAFAGPVLALVGLGLALFALMIFALLDRAIASKLDRVVEKGGVLRVLASPMAGILSPLLVVTAFGALFGAGVLSSSGTEAVALITTSLALLAIQGAVAWLFSARNRWERFGATIAGGVLIAVFSVVTLADAAWRSPAEDPAVASVSHQTLLGAHVVPALRRSIGGPELGPIILLAGKARRITKRGAARRTPAKPRQVKSPPVRNLLLLTFDRFDPKVVGAADASALQELAARASRIKVRLVNNEVADALKRILERPRASLGSWLKTRGYVTAGLLAYDAKGRGKFAPRGFDQYRLVDGDKRNSPADATILKARTFLRQNMAKRWLLWVHLPGPWGKSQSSRRAAATKAGKRLEWLLSELRRTDQEDRSVVIVIGFPHTQEALEAVALVSEPGKNASISPPMRLETLAARLRSVLRRHR